MAERLWVVRDGEVIADLDRDTSLRLRLQFRPEIVERSYPGVLISLSLPVRQAAYEEVTLRPFFEGLLSEGRVRDQLATRFHLDPSDVFGFLREFGRDCAGALTLVPADTDLTTADDDDVEWLDDDALATHVADLAVRPLADEPDQGVRMSLAGAQNKMPVVIRDQRIGRPHGTTPSTHIIKPASVERRRADQARLLYPSLVANEAFCMVLARHAGLSVAPVTVRPIGGEPALIVERYDRAGSGAGVTRVHQEDFGQALGISPLRKYQREGGPGLDRYRTLVRQASVEVIDDEAELLDRVAFNYVIGNDDAHMKNFSLIHAEARIWSTRLAPAYDLLSTFIYPELEKSMAVAINGMYDSRALRPVHWQKAFEQVGVSVKLYSERFGALADRILSGLEPARTELAGWQIGNGKLDELVRLITMRSALLQGLR